MDKDLLATIFIVAAMLVALVDFFAPFFIVGYKSNPVITGAFMSIAGVIAGFKWGKKK